jgi:hypothetical protein
MQTKRHERDTHFRREHRRSVRGEAQHRVDLGSDAVKHLVALRRVVGGEQRERSDGAAAVARREVSAALEPAVRLLPGRGPGVDAALERGYPSSLVALSTRPFHLGLTLAALSLAESHLCRLAAAASPESATSSSSSNHACISQDAPRLSVSFLHLTSSIFRTSFRANHPLPHRTACRVAWSCSASGHTASRWPERARRAAG